MFWPILQFSTSAEHCSCMKACLLSAGVVLNFLIKKLTIYTLNLSPSCIAQNIVIGFFILGHPILIYKLRNLNKKL